MKKIFRMALVFALAGATLMYTGCSKDYGEEIDKLDSKISSLQTDLTSKLSDLEGQLSTLRSSVNALDAAYKAADDAIKGDVTKLQNRVAAIEEAIKDLDKLATKQELNEAKAALEKKIADDLAALKAELLAKAEDLQNQINTLDAALKLKADADKVYTKEEVDAFLAKYFTKEEINEFLAKKADKDAVYTKDEINEFLAKKADADKVYTKEEVNKMLEAYYTKEQVDDILKAYYTKEEIDEALKNYFTKAEIEEMLEAYYTKDEVDKILEDYYTKAQIEEMLEAYYTKEEIDEILKAYYTKDQIDEILLKYYTKEEIDAKFAGYYTKEEIDAFLAKYYTKEEIDAALKELKDAQDKLNELYELLSDELRSIVFLPDLYFAGIEATTYDFASFNGLEILKEAKDYAFYAPAFENGFPVYDEDGDVAGVEGYILKGAPYEAVPLFIHDLFFSPIYFKIDPETGDFVRDDAGNPVQAKASDTSKAPYFPGNFVVGQVGKAKYSLNPSTFATADAEWSLEGRNVKYLVKSDDSTWTPVFLGIEKDADGIATVSYDIEHPEWLFSSVLGGVVDGAISWIGTIKKIIEIEQTENSLRAGSYENWYEFKQRLCTAFEYDFNNIPTMHLVGTLSDGRRIVSDWHAISSFEEVVDHLAFRNDNPYVIDHSFLSEWDDDEESYEDPDAWDEEFEDCGIAPNFKTKDLYPDALWSLMGAPSVPVKYNGGPVDLAELIAIHTMDYDSNRPYNNYTLAEFNAKYPGYHFEFTLVPYTNGDYDTIESYYGQINGTEFTPCWVKSVDKKPVSVPIAKDEESAQGISAVGRMPMVLVTLVGDETGYVHAAGWFRILIAKDVKEPEWFKLPDLPKVPYICGQFKLLTEWHEFSDFVLEALGVDYKLFKNTYEFDGIWAYNAKGKFNQVTGSNGGYIYVDGKEWGDAYYAVDREGSAINDVFVWYVSPTSFGEETSHTIYWRFHNGEQVVYFEMTAETAKRAKMDFVTNKINKEWYDDINAEAKNTVRMNVPVPTADKTTPVIGGDVLKFQRDINHWFVGYRPILGLDEAASDPVYKNFFNAKNGPNPNNKGYSDPDAGYGYGYDDPELFTRTSFFFDKNQPKINGTQLYTNWWGAVSFNGTNYPAGKLLYAVDAKKSITVIPDGGTIDDVTMVPEPLEDNFIAWIMPTVPDPTATDDFGGPRVSDTLLYLHTPKAKELLNLWSYKETDQAKMLYANIVAKSWYGSCDIALPDGNFHVRFIRPLDVNFRDLDVAEESAVDGWNVLIAKFLSDIKDWNNQDVIVPKPERDANGKVKKDSKGNIIYTPYFEPNVIKTVDMFKYYGFTKMSINLADAEINNWDTSDPAKFGKVSEKVPEARLAIGTVDEETGKFTPTTTTTFNVTFNGDLTGLEGYYLNYRNDEAYSLEFALQIPVKVEYAWGTLNAKIRVNVKETDQTTPGN